MRAEHRVVAPPLSSQPSSLTLFSRWCARGTQKSGRMEERTMRICFLCQEDIVKPQGGTGTYVRNVSRALAARGHDVSVIARRCDEAPAHEEVDGVHVHRVDAPGPPVLYSPLYFME